MTVGSLFSGIGGFDLAFERAGFDLSWSCEIEAFPRKVLAKHWPDVPCYEDVRGIGAANLSPVDVLVGGFPCQDLSVAGKRGGLAGARSGLFFEFMRIADELKPDWMVIENVPGLFSSHRGADFAVVVNALVELGYGVAWRVLDSQFFGVPQRRRRVFIVGRAGGQRDRAAAVLFEPESGERDSAAGHEARQGTARGVTDGVGFALRSDPGGTGQAHNTNYVAATLQGGGHSGEPEPGSNLVVFNWQSCGDCRLGNFSDMTDALHAGQTPAVFASSGESARALTATIHRRHDEDTDTLLYGDKSGPLDTDGHTVAVAFAQNQRDEVRTMDVAGSLASEPGTKQTTYVLVEMQVRRLTPLECERLQDFPDGHTCLCGCQPYATATCKCPDSPRYRALGNAVTVSVVNWIAQRIEATA